MQISPPSVEMTVKDSPPQSGRMSKRRLFSLVATAAIASSLGVGLGSTLRFQMVSVVGKTPLFTPQQDFPPLKEWPPQLPASVDPYDEGVPGDWDSETSQSLVYSDSTSTDIENYPVYSEEESAPEQSVVLEDVSRPIADSLVDQNVRQRTDDAGFEPEDGTLAPALSNQDTFETEDVDALAVPLLESNDPVSESYPWFDKRPMSATEFTDGPIIIAPVDSSAAPDDSLN